ncbi:MAG: uracil-DNA glycosylase [Methylobacteriaceae bacterium]|nr:uracil-DNA glycosylase [Methylobacteriaceae bacterium]
MSTEPTRDCPLCPRLVDFRSAARERQPTWHNAPVPSFGAGDPVVLIVGLAPGLSGANRTGRPFTGDWAGRLLYETLIAFGLAHGRYEERPDDGLTLDGCLITNAVRCVPPENRPTPAEIATCRHYLAMTMAGLLRLRGVVALGRIAHDSVLRALGARPTRFAFAHGAEHRLLDPDGRAITVFDSYHCSRYNTNTGVLTAEMFQAVFSRVRAFIDRSAAGP